MAGQTLKYCGSHENQFCFWYFVRFNAPFSKSPLLPRAKSAGLPSTAAQVLGDTVQHSSRATKYHHETCATNHQQQKTTRKKKMNRNLNWFYVCCWVCWVSRHFLVKFIAIALWTHARARSLSHTTHKIQKVCAWPMGFGNICRTSRETRFTHTHTDQTHCHMRMQSISP